MGALPADDSPPVGGAGIAERFRQLDRDGDGRVTREEAGDAELHARLDRDQDGSVTPAEARESLASMREARARVRTFLSGAPGATVAEGVDVRAEPTPRPADVPVSASRAFLNLAFARDWEPGTADAAGERMGGTETIRLLAHGGRLFAATGCWMDLPYGERGADHPPWTGPQILVKDSAKAAWRVDVSWPLARRVQAILSARFVTDGEGNALDPPVDLLVAAPISSRLDHTGLWSRDDASGTWAESVVVDDAADGIRSLCVHRDRVTGVQSLFGGLSAGAVCRAVYDPSKPGRLRWTAAPELSGTGRVMCLAEANGVLYAAGGIRDDETTLSGGLFRRVDGASPRWELVWRWPHRVVERGDEPEILRGLTAVRDPLGSAHEVLLGTCAYPGAVYRIDPARGFAVTTELDIREYFAKVFGVPTLRGPCLSAYNDFLPATDPDTGEAVHLLGVWITHPAGKGTPEGASAWYLVRHADGTYSHGRVFDPAHPAPNPPRGLSATRTIAVSPFPEELGRVLYAGGFDCARIESRDTAWIYKGTPRSAPKGRRISYYKDGELHVKDLATGEDRTLTTGHFDFKPSWSRTGDMLVFFRRLVNDREVGNWKTAISVVNVDGTGLHHLTDGTHTDFNPTWTRDGTNTPIWNRKNPDTGAYQVMAGRVGGKPGEEVALTDARTPAWGFTCLKDGRILVSAQPPGQQRGYFLMRPGAGAAPTFERLTCELARTGLLDRISVSPGETRVCFEYQPGFRPSSTGRTLYVADFDATARTITNARPFANEERKPVWFAYPRWTADESAIVYHAGGRLFRYALAEGTTTQVSDDDGGDYRYPHGEGAPK